MEMKSKEELLCYNSLNNCLCASGTNFPGAEERERQAMVSLTSTT